MTSEDQPGESGRSAADSAKNRTIQQLNEFEAKKAEAKKSLDEKLSAFRATLPEEEQALLQSLLGSAVRDGDCGTRRRRRGQRVSRREPYSFESKIEAEDGIRSCFDLRHDLLRG